MIHSVRFTAVLDTNVLYPVIIRDLLFWFAHYDLYTPKWSQHIFEEWRKVIIKNHKGLKADQLTRQIQLANEIFPFAMVKNYDKLVDSLELDDPDDRHILAAAIKENANVIVTQNLSDFPLKYVASFGIDVKSPDDFICDIIDLDHEKSVEAFRQMVLQKKNPDVDEYEVLDMLRNNGLKKSADFIHSQI
ncbi:MAG: PIN domain-containing protein [Bacteroidota bacterium]